MQDNDRQEAYVFGPVTHPLSRRNFMKATAGFSAMLLLTACGGDDDDGDDGDNDAGAGEPTPQSTSSTAATEPADDSSESGEAKTGGTVSMADQRMPPTLDIHATTDDFLDIIGQNVYQPLVYLDPETKEPVAGLTESWDVSEDGTIWTFNLKQDITFHDDTALTSEAVQASWDRLLDPATQAPRAALLGADNLVSVEIPDDFSVVVTHKEPMANFLANIARTFAMVISPAAIEEFGDKLSENMVGTGPFKLKEYVPADHTTLERWDAFKNVPSFFKHEGPAYLDEFTFHHITEEGTRIAAFESGDLQIVRLPWSQFTRFDEGMPGVTTSTISNPGIPGFLFLNTQLEPLGDLKVRQALGYALNREPILAAPIFGGATWLEWGPLTMDMLGYDPAVVDIWPKYDLDKAKELLAEAGFVEGSGGTLELDGTPLSLTLPVSPTTAPIAQVIQAQWKEVGVELVISQLDPAGVTSEWNSGKHHVVINAYTSNDPDVLWDVFHTGEYGHVTDDKVDELLEEGRTTVEADKRLEVYSEVQKYLAEQIYSLHIYNSARNYGVLDTIHGISFNGRAGMYYYDIWRDE